MSGHTPGPWEAIANPHYWEVVSSGEQVGDACASKYLDVGDNGEANARLMAAAPELLEALIECLTCEFAVTEKTAVAKAQAAIAKATGESA